MRNGLARHRAKGGSVRDDIRRLRRHVGWADPRTQKTSGPPMRRQQRAHFFKQGPIAVTGLTQVFLLLVRRSFQRRMQQAVDLLPALSVHCGFTTLAAQPRSGSDPVTPNWLASVATAAFLVNGNQLKN